MSNPTIRLLALAYGSFAIGHTASADYSKARLTTTQNASANYPDSRYFADRIPGSSLLVDVTGEGQITDNDVLIQVSNKLRGNITDQDGDGVVTAADTIILIKQVLDASGGDFNDDKEVTVEDFTKWLERFVAGQADVKSMDVSGDSIVDTADYSALFTKIGSKLGYRTVTIAELMYPSVIEFIVEYPDGVVASDWITSAEHHGIISKSYPPAGHERHVSKQWPENHMATISRGWSEPIRSNPGFPNSSPIIPAHDLAYSEGQWPANHEQFVSRGWGTPTGHLTGTSETTPPSHDGILSNGWKDHPNHVGSVSKGWYPDNDRDNIIDPEERHDQLVSDVWFPGHSKSRSDQRQLPEHHTDISGPGVDPTRTYPPNHTGTISGTWGPMHTMGASLSFPPSHLGVISADRDQRLIPWPANHRAEQSASDSQPVPTFPRPTDLLPPGVLPDGHSWFTTIQNVVPRP